MKACVIFLQCMHCHCFVEESRYQWHYVQRPTTSHVVHRLMEQIQREEVRMNSKSWDSLTPALFTSPHLSPPIAIAQIHSLLEGNHTIESADQHDFYCRWQYKEGHNTK